MNPPAHWKYLPPLETRRFPTAAATTESVNELIEDIYVRAGHQVIAWTDASSVKHKKKDEIDLLMVAKWHAQLSVFGSYSTCTRWLRGLAGIKQTWKVGNNDHTTAIRKAIQV